MVIRLLDDEFSGDIDHSRTRQFKVQQLDHEANEAFYNVSNLPLADQKDWEKRMIYRVFLRSPYPPAIWQPDEQYSIHLGLINEMSLFPQNALQKGIRFECYVEIVSADRPDENLASIEVEIDGLNDLERQWTNNTDLHWPGYSGGRGACKVKLRTLSTQRPDSFLLKIGIVRGQFEDSLFVLPLLVGPFRLAKGPDEALTGEEMLFFYRQLSLPTTQKDRAILIRESPEIAIPGKIWDSALFASRAALSTLQKHVELSASPVVLDLSCGTGVCGIWLAAVLGQQYQTAEVILTDLEEAVPVMNANLALNSHRLPSKITTKVKVLPWGDNKKALDLGILDLVIACDLIYEADLLPLLMQTLDALTTPGRTNVIIGYKQRGLTKAEKDSLWLNLAKLFNVERLPPALGSMDRECLSDGVGVELWRLWKEDATFSEQNV